MSTVGVADSDCVRYVSVPAGFHPPIRTDRHGHRPRNVPGLPRPEGGSVLRRVESAAAMGVLPILAALVLGQDRLHVRTARSFATRGRLLARATRSADLATSLAIPAAKRTALPASQSAQGIAIRRDPAGATRGHTAGTIPGSPRAEPGDRILPRFHLPIGAFAAASSHPITRKPRRRSFQADAVLRR
jgi:hypothetical protein